MMSSHQPAPRPVDGEPGESPPLDLLVPQQNQLRNLHDLSGVWQFQLDPDERGEADAWFNTLPDPRPIAVPGSWNDLYDDARDYLGLAWYLRALWIPAGWRGVRILLRVGSANFEARVWVNGTFVTEHAGGHLPFVADVTDHLRWDRPNVIAISIENKPLPDRVPPGPTPGNAGVAGLMAGYPATTYDFFPYSGLHRPVLLFSVPMTHHVDDITVTTAIDGADGVVDIRVHASDGYAGTGRVEIDGQSTGLAFHGGIASANVRVPSARPWSPASPTL
jgi:beta-glucuronidase